MANRIAWILGAGFSQSLGGPLLNGLLAPEVFADLDARFDHGSHPKLFDAAASAALWLHAYGRRFDQGRLTRLSWRHSGDGERLWWDTEDFLDKLDAAAGEKATHASHKRLQALVTDFDARERLNGPQPSLPLPPPNLASVAAASRRLVAGQCTAITDSILSESERAQPYLRWANELVQPQDSAITFNYDLVPERLYSRTRKLRTALPPDGRIVGEHLCPAYKLHGSINWIVGEDGKINESPDDHIALTCPDVCLALACPGPTKAATSKQLAGLWDKAMQAIVEADGIIFIGYRFPPTDAHSRTRILDAISANQQKSLDVRVVLGPAVNGPDVVRTKSLLEFALARRTLPNAGTLPVQVLPLYAEDYLSVVHGHGLRSLRLR